MRFSLTCLVFFVLHIANAQIEKGTIAAGGSLSMSYKSLPKYDQKVFDFVVAPYVGFFVVKNFQIGPKIGYSVNSTKQSSGTTDLTQNFIIGPQIKYFIKIGNKAYVHIGGAVFGEFGSFKQLTDPPSNTTLGNRGAGWELGPGLTFFVTKTVAIEVSPQYRGEYTQLYLKNQGGIIANSANSTINHGFFLNIGFSIFIPRKSVEK